MAPSLVSAKESEPGCNDEHLVVPAPLGGPYIYSGISLRKAAMEMPEYGKHGKPKSRLPTLSTLFGNPFGIPTFPRPRRLDLRL